MAIVAKHIIEKRRAEAAAAKAAEAAKDAAVAAPPCPVPVTNPTPPPQDGTPMNENARYDVAHRPRKRGHAIKNEAGKYLPTGPKGFAAPPVETQFKKGCKGGPGRPKGLVSHDALLKKHLMLKREVTIAGRRQSKTIQELLVMATIKAALEGKDKRARDYILAISERLYPKEALLSGSEAVILSVSDELSLAEYEQELRDQLSAELATEAQRQSDSRM